MAVTYSALKAEIASYYNRNDLTSQIDTFIDLCEADMQVLCKNLEFEVTDTLTVTAGSASLPTGWLGARSVQWLSTPPRTLTYVPPDRLDTVNARYPATTNYYTVTGSTLKFADDGDGSVKVVYNAAFTPLSDSNTSNALLASFPSAYLFGSLKQAAIFCKDVEGAAGYGTEFAKQMVLINANNKDRKYVGPLQVRPG